MPFFTGRNMPVRFTLSLPMSAHEPEILEPQPLQDFTGLDEYQFSGDTTTVLNKRGFLAAYRTQASVFHAAAIAGINRATVYKYLQRDPIFAAAFEDCKEDTADSIETSVYHEARYGNNPLLKMFWLKAHRPEYRDRVTLDLPAMRSELQTRLHKQLVTGNDNGQLRTPAPPSHQLAKKNECEDD